MKYILTFIIYIHLLNLHSQDYKSILKKIESKSTKKIMKELFVGKYINFIDYNEDTLFMIENYGIDTGKEDFRIWNRNNELNFTYYKNSFEFRKEAAFGNKVISLVQNWDLEGIKKEIKNNEMLSSVSYCNGYRIIINHKNIEVSKIFLDQFTW